jgi:hypothetical protein
LTAPDLVAALLPVIEALDRLGVRYRGLLKVQPTGAEIR